MRPMVPACASRAPIPFPVSRFPCSSRDMRRAPLWSRTPPTPSPAASPRSPPARSCTTPAPLAAVLVDAPCSATGTMARHPDARWRVTPRTIARAAERQRALLAAAAELVHPGGLLVYATCSLEPEENNDIVTEFLARHSQFARASAADAVPAVMLTPAGDFQSLPQRHGIDGACAARLARVRLGRVAPHTRR